MQSPDEPDARYEQLIRAHEDERKLIVYDIHDGITQYIAGAMMHLESARSRCSGVDPKSADQLEKAWQLLPNSMREARSLMNKILPPILDEKGIVAAIEYLVAEHLNHHTTEVEFSHTVDDVEISPLIEVALFRIVQQALANIWQHSEAPTAKIELHRTDERIQLSICDVGCGFEFDTVDAEGIGLRSMQDRVLALSGELKIESSEQGTRLFADLPTADQLERERRLRIQAEADRRAAHDRATLALQASSDAIWDCDLINDEVFWNEGYNRIFGERPPETKDSWQWWIDHIHVDDRQRVSSSLIAASTSTPDYGDRWTESYRYQRVDGSFANIQDRAFIARNAEGKPTRIVGCMLETGRERMATRAD